jgi:hypothetical protein
LLPTAYCILLSDYRASNLKLAPWNSEARNIR